MLKHLGFGGVSGLIGFRRVWGFGFRCLSLKALRVEAPAHEEQKWKPDQIAEASSDRATLANSRPNVPASALARRRWFRCLLKT